MLDFEKIVSQVKSILPSKGPVSLHEPLFLGNEWKYVKECLDTGWVSSVGKYVDLFERKITEITGVPHAVAVVNGTAALHMCLKLVDVRPGDEVLIPALTFVATANVVEYCSAIPHFVDSDYESLGVDPDKVDHYLSQISQVNSDGCRNKKSGRRIRALIAMHAFGHPVDLDRLKAICEKYKLELIEDAAESLGSLYKGRHTGAYARVSALSFNGNKIVTTGGGGAILINDEELAKQAKHLTTTGKRPHQWAFHHDVVAYNYRLPNLNAALGCAQLEQLSGFLERKRNLAHTYQRNLEGIEGVCFFIEPKYAKSNYWLNALLLEKKYSAQRDDLLEKFHQNGILSRPAWTLMHKLPMFAECPRMDLSVAEDLEQRLINLPSSASLFGTS